MANPIILERGKEFDWYYEGCLSYPNNYLNIKRVTEVTVEYMNRKGKRKQEKLTGFKARVFLHEMDHLIGVCLVGDGWRAGKTLTAGELYKKREAEAEARRADPNTATAVLALATAAGIGSRYKPPPKRENKCTRTACPNDGQGYYHKHDVKGDPSRSNYCEKCAKLINEANGQTLILPNWEVARLVHDGHAVSMSEAKRLVAQGYNPPGPRKSNVMQCYDEEVDMDTAMKQMDELSDDARRAIHEDKDK
jgi:hypothetical protein